MGLGEEDHMGKVTFSTYHIKGTCYHQHDSSLMMQTLIIWPIQCLLSFSAVKLCFPFPHSTLWKQVTKCSPQSRGGELSATFLRGDYLYKLFGVLCMGDFSFSPHFFIYSDIYLHQYGFMDIYVLSYNLILLLFLKLLQF